MSHQAVEWALCQPISHAPAKQILTVMAHYAHKDQRPWTAYPSVTQLVRDTGQDRKTILANLLRLVECGALRDTGERAGMTKSVTVYELSEPTSDTKTGTASRAKSSPKSGTASNTQAVPKLELLSSPETGTSSGNGSSTSFSGSSTSFAGKQSQNPPEAVPVFPTEQVEQVLGTGIGTGNRAPARTPSEKAQRKTKLPDGFGLSERVRRWAAEKGHTNLDRHLEHFIGSAKARGYAYVDWDEALMNAIRSNWAKVSVPNTRPGSGLPPQNTEAINAEAKRLLFGAGGARPQHQEVIDV